MLLLYLSNTLDGDRQREISEAQFSTVSLIVKQVDVDLRDRLKSLEENASAITPKVLDYIAVLKDYFKQHLAFQILFSQGNFVTHYAGDVVFDLPISPLQFGKSYMQVLCLQKSQVMKLLKSLKD